MINELTYQQQLVWKRLTDGVKSIDEANSKLEARASLLVAGSTGITSTIAGANLFPATFGQLGTVEGVLLAVLCGLALLMIWFAARVWGPSSFAVPGGSDVKKLYDNYIAVGPHIAFNRAMMDLAKAFEHGVWANKHKGADVRRMFRVLQAQIAVLGVGVIARLFS